MLALTPIACVAMGLAILLSARAPDRHSVVRALRARYPSLVALELLLWGGTLLAVVAMVGTGAWTSSWGRALFFACVGYVGVRVLFAPYEVMLGRCGPIDAVRGAWSLTRGRLLRVLALGAVLGGVTMAVGLVANLMGGDRSRWVAGGFLEPVQIAIFTRAYLQLPGRVGR